MKMRGWFRRRADDLDAEGPDAAWLEEESKRRREHFERERAQARVLRLAHRERQPLSQRLASIEKSILLAAVVPAAGTSAGGGGKPTSKPPPQHDNLEVGGAPPQEARRLIRIVHNAVRQLEGLVDAQQYGGSTRPQMIGTDLDHLLRTEYRGFTPEDVSLLEPSLGSPAAVRKSRQLLGLHRETGDEMKKGAKVAGSTLYPRRV